MKVSKITKQVQQAILTNWINNLIKKANTDKDFQVDYFYFKNFPIVIAGGWSAATYPEQCKDLFYIKDRTHILCMKIVVNDSSCTYENNFDNLIAPQSYSGEIEDSWMPIERQDRAEDIAQFFLYESFRLLDNVKERIPVLTTI